MVNDINRAILEGDAFRTRNLLRESVGSFKIADAYRIELMSA